MEQLGLRESISYTPTCHMDLSAMVSSPQAVFKVRIRPCSGIVINDGGQGRWGSGGDGGERMEKWRCKG